MFRRALAAAILLASAGSGRAPDDTEPTFVFYWMKIHGRRMDTLAYDFNGDGRLDLLNTSIDFDLNPPARWFSLHIRDEKGQLPAEPTFLWTADDRAAALCFGDFVPGGGIEIAFIATDGVYYYPWADGKILETPKKLLHLRTFFTTVPSNSIPIWSLAEDLDGDGRHDLILPTPDGYRVYFQTEPGRFGAVANPEANLTNGSGVLQLRQFAEKKEFTPGHFSAVRQLPRVVHAQIDGKYGEDLLTIEKDVATYFFQGEGRTYPSRRPYRTQYTVPTLHEEVKKDTVNLSQISFVDINQDGLADLVVTKIEGTLGLTDSIKTRIYLHLGTGRGNFLADKVIQIDGVSIDPAFVDMNLDGKLDVVTSRLRTDLLKQAINAFVLGDITISYEIFQFDPKTNSFMPETVWSKDVLVSRGDLESKGVASIGLVMIRGDFSGDGRPDMLYIDPKREYLELRRGRVHWQHGREVIGFEENAFFEVKLEDHPKWVYIWDANGDGIMDAYLMYGGGIAILESRKK